MTTAALRAFAVGVALGSLAACQSSGSGSVSDTDGAHTLATTLADAVRRCWFAGDTAFADYVYAPETNAGQPRILIVRKNEPGGLPALVIEPKARATADIYGPLMASPIGPRISADIDRWAKGSAECG